MSLILQPWQFLLAIVAGWINEQQQLRIEFPLTEVQVLQEKLGKKRISLDDDQRRRLAVKGKALGHKVLGEICTLFTPDTILRWHRQLVAPRNGTTGPSVPRRVGRQHRKTSSISS